MTDVVDLLAELIAFPTQQGGGLERPMCEHLTRYVQSADQIVVGDAPRTDGTQGAYIFARWGEPRRVINAHVDTVPANANWTTPPHEPRRTSDRIYGLGSADTKGAIAATIVALEALGGKPTNAGVLFSGDEEAGSRVLEAFLASPHVAGVKEMIVCEPTARRAGTAHRGVLGQRATASGPGGHSSKADHLPKPLADLARLATAIDDLGRARLTDGPAGMTGTCLNIASLAGGVAFNVIAAHAELEWSLRPYPGFDRASWDADVAAAIARLPQPIALATTIDHPPFLCEALAAEVGPHVREVGALDFWTEAALYQLHGIDAIVVGPGDIAQAHSPDEFVTFDDLHWAVDLYRALLAKA